MGRLTPSSVAEMERHYQLRKARSLSNISRGSHGEHPYYKCPSCEDPWVGKLHRSVSSEDLAPIRRPVHDTMAPVITSQGYATKWYTNAYRTPWYDSNSRYHYPGGYQSPHRYYPSPLGGYTYIHSVSAPQNYYPNDWYHKFKSVQLGWNDPFYGRLLPYNSRAEEVAEFPSVPQRIGPHRAMAQYENGLISRETLNRSWIANDSMYRKFTLGNRLTRNFDFPFGNYFSLRPPKYGYYW